ncbi:MAG: hypothetical protein QOE72_1448 [Chloroflexota bacterium]|jgi:hypothetical protein|nr:hypothetical protein [Chloroflexota bacterium]
MGSRWSELPALGGAARLQQLAHPRTIPPQATRRPPYRRTSTLRHSKLVMRRRIVRGGQRVRLRLLQGTWWARHRSPGALAVAPQDAQLRGEGLGVGPPAPARVRRHHRAAGAASGSLWIAAPAGGALAAP